MALAGQSLETLSLVETVMAEYTERLTIRQVYYRLVRTMAMRTASAVTNALSHFSEKPVWKG